MPGFLVAVGECVSFTNNVSESDVYLVAVGQHNLIGHHNLKGVDNNRSMEL